MLSTRFLEIPCHADTATVARKIKEVDVRDIVIELVTQNRRKPKEIKIALDDIEYETKAHVLAPLAKRSLNRIEGPIGNFRLPIGRHTER